MQGKVIGLSPLCSTVFMPLSIDHSVHYQVKLITPGKELEIILNGSCAYHSVISNTSMKNGEAEENWDGSHNHL